MQKDEKISQEHRLIIQHAIEKNQSLSGSFDQTSVANWIANGASDIDSFTQFVLSNASQYRRDIVNEKFN